MGQAYNKDGICAKQVERAAPLSDMHTKSDFPLSDRGPPWPRLPRGCDSTTATVMLVDGMIRPS